MTALNTVAYDYLILNLTILNHDLAVDEHVRQCAEKFVKDGYIVGGYHRFEYTDTVAIFLVKPKLKPTTLAA